MLAAVGEEALDGQGAVYPIQPDLAVRALPKTYVGGLVDLAKDLLGHIPNQ